MCKPVLNIQIKSAGMNIQFAENSLKQLRKFADKLSDSYEVIITPKEAEIEFQSNNGFNAINLYISDTCDFKNLHEFLTKQSEGG